MRTALLLLSLGASIALAQTTSEEVPKPDPTRYVLTELTSKMKSVSATAAILPVSRKIVVVDAVTCNPKGMVDAYLSRTWLKEHIDRGSDVLDPGVEGMRYEFYENDEGETKILPSMERMIGSSIGDRLRAQIGLVGATLPFDDLENLKPGAIDEEWGQFFSLLLDEGTLPDSVGGRFHWNERNAQTGRTSLKASATLHYNSEGFAAERRHYDVKFTLEVDHERYFVESATFTAELRYGEAKEPSHMTEGTITSKFAEDGERLLRAPITFRDRVHDLGALTATLPSSWIPKDRGTKSALWFMDGRLGPRLAELMITHSETKAELTSKEFQKELEASFKKLAGTDYSVKIESKGGMKALVCDVDNKITRFCMRTIKVAPDRAVTLILLGPSKDVGESASDLKTIAATIKLAKK